MKTKINITETETETEDETSTETSSLGSDDPSARTSDDHVLKINCGDYILVKFFTKYYIGCVISSKAQNEAEQDDLNASLNEATEETTYLVKFLRKVSENTFIFPNIEDIAFINSQSVKSVLNQPDIDRREKYVFNDAILKEFSVC